MAKLKAGNIEKNMFVLYNNRPHKVVFKKFVSPGKGSAFTRTKLQDLDTGSIFDFVFKSHDTVEEVDVESRELQFLYVSGEQVVFMDPRTFEQVEISGKVIEDKVKYLVPELKIYVQFYQERALSISLPPKVRMKVVEAEDAVAGDRQTAGKKPVTMETGLIVQAPLFIDRGEELIVDTESGEYVSRAN